MAKILSVHVSGAAVGQVIPMSTITVPLNYLLCNGLAVSRTVYAALFALIGVTHGSGDGSTTFNLPDYRGRFLRGLDGTASQDPDKTSRTAMSTGGNTGNLIGSVQADGFQGHRHAYNRSQTGALSTAATAQISDATTNLAGAGTAVTDPTTDGTNGAPRTTSETRPKNAYVNYIIAYK